MKLGRFVAVSGLVAAVVVLNPPASGVTQAALGATTFEFTGEPQQYVVPAGVTQIEVDAWGAQGGAYDISKCETGGFGGRTTATLTVVPGQTLAVFVGGAGATWDGTAKSVEGGFNGGGNGQMDTIAGSRGGGGASDVRIAPYGLADREVVAGGGGGAGNLAGVTAGGAGGGLVGAPGSGAPYAGGGGTQVAGGVAGTDTLPVWKAATAGTFGAGGDGGYTSGTGAYTGGGGGGGWFGGGGAGGRASSRVLKFG